MDDEGNDAGCDAIVAGLLQMAREDAGSVDTERWSASAFETARGPLARRAKRAYRRRVAVALAVALLPLPLIAFYDSVLLEGLYGLATMVLPHPLPAFAVGGYAGAAVFLLAATYAAIPILVEISSPKRITARPLGSS